MRIAADPCPRDPGWMAPPPARHTAPRRDVTDLTPGGCWQAEGPLGVATTDGSDASRTARRAWATGPATAARLGPARARHRRPPPGGRPRRIWRRTYRCTREGS